MINAKLVRSCNTTGDYCARKDFIFILILIAGLALRLYLALTTSHIWDEELDWIPIAEKISLSPGNVYLPIHDFHHPSLPAYFIRAGSMLFGSSAIGFRISSLIAGMLTIVLAFRFALKWSGPTAARWTAALLAFNEYHIGISILATEKSFYLLFAMLAMYAFSRFIDAEKPGYLYLAGASIALGILCKYLSGLLIPVFITVLFLPKYRHWLRRKEPYIAFLIFFVIITPDLFWNIRSLSIEGIQLEQMEEPAQGSLNIRDHFFRGGGPGFNSHHFLFFVRGAVRKVFSLIGWGAPHEWAGEYPSMNSLFGLILFGGVLLMTLREKRQDPILRYLEPLFYVAIGFVVLISIKLRSPNTASGCHLMNFLCGLVLFGGMLLIILRDKRQEDILRFLMVSFWVVFGFFVLIRPRPSQFPFVIGPDPVAWHWVDMTLLIAALLVGHYLSGLQEKWRFICYSTTGAATLYAVVRVLVFRIGMY